MPLDLHNGKILSSFHCLLLHQEWGLGRNLSSTGALNISTQDEMKKVNRRYSLGEENSGAFHEMLSLKAQEQQIQEM